MSNVAHLRQSDNLLERAAYWAAAAAWLYGGVDFEQAQADCKALQEQAQAETIFVPRIEAAQPPARRAEGAG